MEKKFLEGEGLKKVNNWFDSIPAIPQFILMLIIGAIGGRSLRYIVHNNENIYLSIIAYIASITVLSWIVIRGMHVWEKITILNNEKIK